MSKKNTPSNITYAAAQAIKHIIDTHPLSREPLSKLAPDIYIGRNRLQSLFKQLTGKTIRRYRLQKRMEAARELLVTGKMTVKQVALLCGYLKLNNFSADYKQEFDITPTDWLRNHPDSQ